MRASNVLTVSDVERSLAFDEAALKPLDIRFFLPYKGEVDHPGLWGFGDGKRALLRAESDRHDRGSLCFDSVQGASHHGQQIRCRIVGFFSFTGWKECKPCKECTHLVACPTNASD